MSKRRRDHSDDLLSYTNPWSIHRRSHVLKWALLVAAVFCTLLGILLYLANSTNAFD